MRQVAEEGADLAKGVLLVLRFVVDDTAAAHVHVDTAELLLREVLANRAFHHRRARGEDLALAPDHHAEVREHGPPSDMTSGRPNDRRGNGDGCQQLRVARPLVPIGEVHAARIVVAASGSTGTIGELHERDAALQGGGLQPPSRPLPATARATAYGEVFAPNADLAASERTEPEDVARRNEAGQAPLGVVLTRTGHAAHLEEGPGVEKALDSLADRELALRTLALDALLAAHAGSQLAAVGDLVNRARPRRACVVARLSVCGHHHPHRARPGIGPAPVYGRRHGPSIRARATHVVEPSGGRSSGSFSMEINGLSAIVTGGGSGLGEATARELASRGARVAILDLGRSNGAEVASSLSGVFVEADVTSDEQVTAAVASAAAAHGGVHLLVNCAGIASAERTVGREGPASLDGFVRTVTINLIGTFNAIRLAATEMVKNDPNAEGERGAIINTASVAAFEGQIGQAAYSASKGGVVGMTLPIARDLARNGVRNNTIAPGLFLTPMLMGLPEAAREALGDVTPFPARLGKPEEYAQLACSIIENPMINGETIRLDGALRLQPR